MVATYKYKQPRRLNAVSLILLVLLGGAGYVGFSAWPVASLYANVRSTMEESLPQVYRANLAPEPASSQQVITIKGTLALALKKAGLEGKPFDIFIKRDKKEVSIEVRFTTALVLAGLDKSFKVSMAPMVKTDAARVQWD